MSQDSKNIVPQHVAIIMDGNGRWAKSRGLNRLKGHEEGAESVRAIINACKKTGVKYLTLYAFSVENWVRPDSEIKGLMSLLVRFLKTQEYELHDNKVRFHVIGRRSDLSREVLSAVERVEESTKQYDEGHLILALSYGARTEITSAAREIARKVKSGEIDVDDIDDKMMSAHMYDPTIPDPDLLIRTSGEMRISNFLLWQISYSELYVTDVMWPDFRADEFSKALEEFRKRQRRFGDIE